MDNQIFKAFESISIPEPSDQAKDATIQKSQQIFEEIHSQSKETQPVHRPNNNHKSKWTMFWSQMMEKSHTHGGMIAASLLTMTVGYGLYLSSTSTSTSTNKLLIHSESSNEEFQTVVEMDSVTASKRSANSSDLITEVQEWIAATEDSNTYVSRTVETQSLPKTSSVNQAAKKKALTSQDYYQPNSDNKFQQFKSNSVKQTSKDPISTFSIDTDTASYSFIRRQLLSGTLPAKDAVRIEEMINYFDYNYPVNQDQSVPFTTTAQVTPSPWNRHNKLIHIGIKAYEPTVMENPKSNLVFLIDTSGSMQSTDKLPLLINSLHLLINTLSEQDTVSIVSYAGQAGVALEPTQIADKNTIMSALDSLISGGSTAGQAGIQQAYEMAKRNFDKEAVNRIFLATDGDFNVGLNDPDALKDLISQERKSGIYLSVLGFGDGNYNDHLMQALAQNGNGQAFYIDTLNEAQKVLVEQASSTLFPVAKDVKIQIEFNPSVVSEYRLIGYETRGLNTEDFNNDKIDAGEIGSGHSVTAIYEITQNDSDVKLIDEPRYTDNQASPQSSAEFNDEYAFIKLRYKNPDGDKSIKVTTAVTTDLEFSALEDASIDTKFSIAVAAFGQHLKQNYQTDHLSFDEIIKLARSASGNDEFGYRSEFIQLVRLAKSLEKQ